MTQDAASANECQSRPFATSILTIVCICIFKMFNN